MKTLSCRDLGIECNFTATGKTEEETVRKLKEHISQTHPDQSLPNDSVLRSKIKNSGRSDDTEEEGEDEDEI